MENPNYEQVVHEAAVWLDGIEPGWHRKIDRKKLDFGHGCDCVLGQLFGDWHNAVSQFPEADFLPEMGATHIGHAFSVYHENVKMPFWLAEIDARLEADKQQAAKSAAAFIERTNEIINLPAKVWEEPTRA